MKKELPQDSGYILIHRKMLDWEWWEDHNTTRLFLYLLLKANWEDKKWRGNEIKRGQLITGVFKLSTSIGLSVQQTRTALNKLKSTNEITIETTNEYSLITVNNYCDYQDINKRNNKRITNEQQTNNKRVTTTNTLNTLNTLKKERENNTLTKISFSKRKNITDTVLQEIADKYQVPFDFVTDCWDSAINWLDAKGQRKSNYKAFLSNWVKREKANYILKSKNNNFGRRGGVVDVRTNN